MPLAYAFNFLISLWAYRRKRLTLSGSLSAFMLGLITLWFGHWTFFPLMMMFFLSSVFIRRVIEVLFPTAHHRLNTDHKKHEARTYVQVLANGGMLGILSLLYYFDPQDAFIYGAALSMAAANADTWASEIGILSSSTPRSLWRHQAMPSGISGGVTALGLWASLAGSLFISSFAMLYFFVRDGWSWAWLVLSGLMIGVGFLGSIIDSLLGEFLQAKYITLKNDIIEVATSTTDQLISGLRWMDNNLVNFFSNVIAVIIMLGLFGLI